MMKENIFSKDDYVFLDGAMGTMLQEIGLELGERPELLCITNPEAVRTVHKMYVDAGSNIIYANTFGANSYKLEGFKYGAREIIDAAIKAGKDACIGTDTAVALDIGPIGELLEPAGTLSFEKAYDIFKEMVIYGESAGADLIVIETMTDLYEVKAALLAAKENSSLPVMVSMSFEENHRTFSGCTVESMVITLEGLGADALGINCSLGPEEILPIARELCNATTLPVFVKPNAGLPNLKTGNYDIDARQFGILMEAYKDLGISMIGGCCGTSPDYVKELVSRFGGLPTNMAERIKSFVPQMKLCSPTSVVTVDHVTIIGETINPMGRKFIKEAYLSEDYDKILACAVEQVENGAEILDVNAGLPNIDEVTMLPKLVKLIQSVVDAPILLDCQNPAALEAALRVYNGKCMINSTNAEEEMMNKIFPLAKKYGAAIVGLTLDENGIPATCEERFALAEKLVSTGIAHGVKKSDMAIDCLTLAVSVMQKEASETAATIKKVTKELGVKAALGVSNISFGLPHRELINRTFLTLALDAGLQLPIMNPLDEGMKDVIQAHKVLSGEDKDCISYIENYSNLPAANALAGVRSVAYISERESKGEVMPSSTHDQSCGCGCHGNESIIADSIRRGLKHETRKAVEAIIDTMDEMDIINLRLIPALDSLGSLFESGKIFLPQLIQGAQAAQCGFEVVNAKLSAKKSEKVNLGTIVLATVKGDIHDIGKNIVKIILQNYGYHIIDLGRDVAPAAVAEAVRKHNAKLVGLSALMTTTLPNMTATVALLRQENLPCKIMVGGAVLTSEFTKDIGADFYAKDAKTSVDIAKEVFK